MSRIVARIPSCVVSDAMIDDVTEAGIELVSWMKGSNNNVDCTGSSKVECNNVYHPVSRAGLAGSILYSVPFPGSCMGLVVGRVSGRISTFAALVNGWIRIACPVAV